MINFTDNVLNNYDSFYKMCTILLFHAIRDAVRYEFTHEILKEEESVWKGETVPRDRRISLVLRCQP